MPTNRKKLFLLLPIWLLLGKDAFTQKHAAAFAAADTSRFSVNAKDGWKLFNSYAAAYGRDSAQLELVLQHDNNTDFKQEQYIGKIKYNPLQPSKPQSPVCGFYQVRMDRDGKCYLKYIGTSAPAGDPLIIPVKLYYKL